MGLENKISIDFYFPPVPYLSKKQRFYEDYIQER